MGWSLGFDRHWNRDIGYGVPAECDHPRCVAAIDRGLASVCGGEPYGGDRGCGLYFCGEHLSGGWGPGVTQLCSRCRNRKPPFTAKPDVAEWIRHKLTDGSWAQWRTENPTEVALMHQAVATGARADGADSNSLPKRAENREKADS